MTPVPEFPPFQVAAVEDLHGLLFRDWCGGQVIDDERSGVHLELAVGQELVVLDNICPPHRLGHSVPPGAPDFAQPR